MLTNISIRLEPATNHDEHRIKQFQNAVNAAKVETVATLRYRIKQKRPTAFTDIDVTWPNDTPNPKPLSDYESTPEAISEQITRKISRGVARQANYHPDYPVQIFRGGTAVSMELSPTKPKTLHQFDQAIGLLSNPESANTEPIEIEFEAVYDPASDIVTLGTTDASRTSCQTRIEFYPEDSVAIKFLNQHESSELRINYHDGEFAVGVNSQNNSGSSGGSAKNFTIPLRNLSVILDDLSDSDLAQLLYNSLIRKRAFDIFTVISGARELAVIHDDSSGTYGDLFFNEFDERFGTQIEKHDNLWYFFSPDASNPEDTIKRVKDGVSSKEMGRLLGYPEGDLRKQMPLFEAISYICLLYLYGEITREQYEYSGLCPYTPSKSYEGVQRAAAYGEQMAESLYEFDSEYGTQIGDELVKTMKLSTTHMDGLGIHDSDDN